MDGRGLSVGAIVLSVLLAGCAGGDGKSVPSPSATAPPAAPTVETGTISGIVVSEEEIPIPDVDVLIEDVNTTRSDASGAWVFNGLEPGAYTVLFSRLGYESIGRNVDVVAGEVSTLRVELATIVVRPEPYYEMTPHEGVVQCSFNPYYSVQPCGTVVAEDTDQFIIVTEPTMPLEELVLELVWTPSVPGTAETMELDFCDARADRQADVLCFQVEEGYYQYETGGSPLVMRLDDVPIDRFNEWVVGAGSGYMEPTFSVQQRFTIYATMCFLEECAEDYTAIPS